MFSNAINLLQSRLLKEEGYVAVKLVNSEMNTMNNDKATSLSDLKKYGICLGMFTVGEYVEQIVHHVHRVFTAVGHEMLKTYNHNISFIQFLHTESLRKQYVIQHTDQP